MRWVILLLLIVALLFFVTMLCNSLTRIHTVSYHIFSEKLNGSLRLALITDLHSARYGHNQSDLMAALAAAKPDAVLLGGDIFDGKASLKNALVFFKEVGTAYPCYFVFGNHEHGTRKLDTIRRAAVETGTPVLEGDCVRLSVGDAHICITGVEDVRTAPEAYREQLAVIGETLGRSEEFSVLLSHEPQFTDELLATGADLILSGHTHGGQWSIPGLVNGLYAPGQGLFPKYAGGLYTFGAQTLVVSRGLSKVPLWFPRLFTPRELVILELSGEN